MEKFNFDTGMKEFEINDAVTVSFNPTDPETIKKIFDVFDSLDAKQAAYKAEIARCGETKEIFDIASAATRKCVRCWTVFSVSRSANRYSAR